MTKSISLILKSYLQLNPFAKVSKKEVEKWPYAKISQVEPEPHFLFILTPPFSGSTAFAKVLNLCPESMILDKKAEGQWLVPGLAEDDRWLPDKVVDWHSVRTTWINTYQNVNTLVTGIKYIIEKSPPNMVRLNSLLTTFPRHTVIALNRNPIASCASALYRGFKLSAMGTEVDRVKILEKLAHNWLNRSRIIQERVIELNLTYFSYEYFCENLEKVVSQVEGLVPGFTVNNFQSKIQVKDYPEQGIFNYNQNQISKLSDLEIEAIIKILRKDKEMCNFFGYYY